MVYQRTLLKSNSFSRRITVRLIFFEREQNSKEGDLLALVRGNVETPYAKIAIITDRIRQLNGRVIRCVYEEGQWKFCSPSIRCYPNSHKTIESKYDKLYAHVYTFI